MLTLLHAHTNVPLSSNLFSTAPKIFTKKKKHPFDFWNQLEEFYFFHGQNFCSCNNSQNKVESAHEEKKEKREQGKTKERKMERHKKWEKEGEKGRSKKKCPPISLGKCLTAVTRIPRRRWRISIHIFWLFKNNRIGRARGTPILL